MIIKIIGIALVMISATLIGFCLSECMVCREREVGNLGDAVAIMEDCLECTMEPVGRLFGKALPHVKGGVHDMFALTDKYVADGMSASKAWCAALDESACALCLRRSDCEYLKACADSFCANDIGQQKMQLKSLRSKISMLGDDIKNYNNKNCRLYKALGVYGGVFLCAVLF